MGAACVSVTLGLFFLVACLCIHPHALFFLLIDDANCTTVRRIKVIMSIPAPPSFLFDHFVTSRVWRCPCSDLSVFYRGLEGHFGSWAMVTTTQNPSQFHAPEILKANVFGHFALAMGVPQVPIMTYGVPPKGLEGVMYRCQQEDRGHSCLETQGHPSQG